MMPYADTDFFLAMAKKEDWLKSGAEKIYTENKGKIDTSIITLLELFLLSERKGLDPESIVGSVFKVANVERLSITEAMQIAHNIKHEGINVFDAFHAALAADREIISSDSVYDRLGKTRIGLSKA